MNYPCVNDLNGNAIDIFVDTLYQKEDTIHHSFFDGFTIYDDYESFDFRRYFQGIIPGWLHWTEVYLIVDSVRKDGYENYRTMTYMLESGYHDR